ENARAKPRYCQPFASSANDRGADLHFFSHNRSGGLAVQGDRQGCAGSEGRGHGVLREYRLYHRRIVIPHADAAHLADSEAVRYRCRIVRAACRTADGNHWAAGYVIELSGGGNTHESMRSSPPLLCGQIGDGVALSAHSREDQI